MSPEAEAVIVALPTGTTDAAGHSGEAGLELLQTAEVCGGAGAGLNVAAGGAPVAAAAAGLVFGTSAAEPQAQRRPSTAASRSRVPEGPRQVVRVRSGRWVDGSIPVRCQSGRCCCRCDKPPLSRIKPNGS